MASPTRYRGQGVATPGSYASYPISPPASATPHQPARFILAIASDALDAVRRSSPSKGGANGIGTSGTGSGASSSNGGGGTGDGDGNGSSGSVLGGFGAAGQRDGQLRQVEAFVAAALSILDKFDLVVHEVRGVTRCSARSGIRPLRAFCRQFFSGDVSTLQRTVHTVAYC